MNPYYFHGGLCTFSLGDVKHYPFYRHVDGVSLLKQGDTEERHIVIVDARTHVLRLTDRWMKITALPSCLLSSSSVNSRTASVEGLCFSLKSSAKVAERTTTSRTQIRAVAMARALFAGVWCAIASRTLCHPLPGEAAVLRLLPPGNYRVH